MSVRVRVRVRVRYFRVTHRLQNRQYFGRHGINVSTGYQLPPLDMGPCAGRCALDAILCRGASSQAPWETATVIRVKLPQP